jgi:hypothetical protein
MPLVWNVNITECIQIIFISQTNKSAFVLRINVAILSSFARCKMGRTVSEESQVNLYNP